ncbi:MAG: hypothetical protein LBR50_04325 [Tannerella sp.]|jgi:hypothetical protein|nr:hypothetical protein [Tannerella sp.]
MEDINSLLEKFYAGATTPDEDIRLKDLILDSTDERYADDRRLFAALYDSQPSVPQDVSERLEAALQQLYSGGKRSAKMRVLWYYLSGAAAVALLCIGIFLSTRTGVNSTMADTYTNPEEAARIAGQTLAYVSQQLNSGLAQASIVGEEVGLMNKVLEQTFETNKNTEK